VKHWQVKCVPQSVEKSKQHHVVQWKMWVLANAAAPTTWSAKYMIIN